MLPEIRSLCIFLCFLGGHGSTEAVPTDKQITGAMANDSQVHHGHGENEEISKWHRSRIESISREGSENGWQKHQAGLMISIDCPLFPHDVPLIFHWFSIDVPIISHIFSHNALPPPASRGLLGVACAPPCPAAARTGPRCCRESEPPRSPGEGGIGAEWWFHGILWWLASTLW